MSWTLETDSRTGPMVLVFVIELKILEFFLQPYCVCHLFYLRQFHILKFTLLLPPFLPSSKSYVIFLCGTFWFVFFFKIGPKITNFFIYPVLIVHQKYPFFMYLGHQNALFELSIFTYFFLLLHSISLRQCLCVCVRLSPQFKFLAEWNVDVWSKKVFLKLLT